MKEFGGKAADYLEIHQFIDSSKAVIADHRHRCLTHNAWFISVVLPRVFGDTIKNSDGKEVSVRDIGEQHVAEDFRGKFIPSAQDWLNHLSYEEWMNNGASVPNSGPKHPANPPPAMPPLNIFPPNLPPINYPTTPPSPWPPEVTDRITDRVPRSPQLYD